MGPGAGPPALVRSVDRTTGAGPSRPGRRRPAPTPAASACRLQGLQHPPQCFGIGSRRHPHQVPVVQDDSTTNGVVGTVADCGTSLNTTTSLAGTLLDVAFLCSPACRNTCRHHVSVLSGIPCCCPYSRSFSPLRCQRANSRRIWRARTDLVDPILSMDSYL